MRFIFLTLVALMVIAIQTMIGDLFFFGKIVVELSLIMTVYTGFHMPLIRGGMLSLILGFFLDCFTGSVSGLFASFYVMAFLLAKFVSLRVYAERFSFIMIFVGLCSLLEAIFVTFFYRLAFGVDKFNAHWDVFLLQALIVSILGPLFFSTFEKLEAIIDR